jgi:hypothetical protein
VASAVSSCGEIQGLAQSAQAAAPAATKPTLVVGPGIQAGCAGLKGSRFGFDVTVQHALFNQLAIFENGAPVPLSDRNAADNDQHTTYLSHDVSVDTQAGWGKTEFNLRAPSGGWPSGSLHVILIEERSINPKYAGTAQERASSSIEVVALNTWHQRYDCSGPAGWSAGETYSQGHSRPVEVPAKPCTGKTADGNSLSFSFDLYCGSLKNGVVPATGCTREDALTEAKQMLDTHTPGACFINETLGAPVPSTPEPVPVPAPNSTCSQTLFKLCVACDAGAGPYYSTAPTYACTEADAKTAVLGTRPYFCTLVGAEKCTGK